ncbi:MAG TPA: MFS transporter [Streptosporangiaceae bacterium]
MTDAEIQEKREKCTEDASISRGPGLIVPLRDRRFRLLFIGQICSLMGDQFYLVALPFLVLNHRSVTVLGEILLVFGVARMATLPVGGILADRFSGARTRLIIGSNAGRMALLVILAAALPATIPPLLVLAAAIGALEGLYLPPSMALLPDVVDESLIGPANALLGAATMAATLAGPALAGLLVVGVGPGAGFAVDAATFAISVVTLSLIGTGRRGATAASDATAGTGPGDGEAATSGGAAEESGTWLGDARKRGAFWQLLRSSRMLQFSLLITLIVNFTYAGAEQIALPVFSKVTLLDGARGYGLLLSAFGGGSLVGALGSGRLFGWPNRAKLALLFGTLQGVALALIPAGHALAVGMAALAVAGICGGMIDVFYVSMLQSKLPAALLGRSMSALMLAALGVYPISVALSGLIVQHFGPTPIFLIDGAVVCAGFLIGFTSREFRNL